MRLVLSFLFLFSASVCATTITKADPMLLLVDRACQALLRGSFATSGLIVQHNTSSQLRYYAYKVRVAEDMDLATLKSNLKQQPCVIRLSENPIVKMASDPLFSQQPALTAIRQVRGEKFFFHPLWGIHTPVTIAVVDSGTQLNHPDLQSRLWRAVDGSFGYDFANDDNDPSDDAGHGTHVAGIALAQKDNEHGIRGVMGEWSQLMTVKSQDANGNGTMADVINALLWAVDQGAGVVNLSLTSTLRNQALEDALAYALSHKVNVVVAAGNDGAEITNSNFVTPIGYAAALDGVIGVGSVDAVSKLRSGFSNYSSTYVEIAAPGSFGTTGILSTFPGNQYRGSNGTSMAAPHVTGAVALVQGFLHSHALSFSPAQVEQLILQSADQVTANQSFFQQGRALNLENLGRYLFNTTFVDSTGGFDDP